MLLLLLRNCLSGSNAVEPEKKAWFTLFAVHPLELTHPDKQSCHLYFIIKVFVQTHHVISKVFNNTFPLILCDSLDNKSC